MSRGRGRQPHKSLGHSAGAEVFPLLRMITLASKAVSDSLAFVRGSRSRELVIGKIANPHVMNQHCEKKRQNPKASISNAMVGQTLSRFIPNTNGCMSTNSPCT